MTSNRTQYLLPGAYDLTPEEIEQAMRQGKRLHAQACREITFGAAGWLARAFRGPAIEPVQAGSIAKQAPAA